MMPRPLPPIPMNNNQTTDMEERQHNEKAKDRDSAWT